MVPKGTIYPVVNTQQLLYFEKLIHISDLCLLQYCSYCINNVLKSYLQSLYRWTCF